MTVCAKLADGTILARDRIAISGEAFRPGKPGVMGPWNCHGTLMVFARNIPPAELCNGLRGAIDDIEGVYAGVSTLPNHAGIWARFLAADAVSLRGAIAGAWKESRRLLTGHEPVARRK
jgi:urease accessory protein